MFKLPVFPPWDGMHPLVVHFPIALFFVAPLLIVLALLWKKHTGILLLTSALLMILAAGAAVIATSTGEAALDLVAKTPGPNSLIEEHEELGEAARNFSIALAGVLTAITGLFWKFAGRIPRGVIIAAGLMYLIAHTAGMLVVANAAHAGGRLVHEAGIHARMSTATVSNILPGAAPARRENSRED